MRATLSLVFGPLALACGFWAGFGACVDIAAPEPPVPARVLVGWEPRECGAPHRIRIALAAVADDARVARSVPCALGWMALDVPHVGDYDARVGPEATGTAPAGSADAALEDSQATTYRLALTAPIVRWTLDAPP